MDVFSVKIEGRTQTLSQADYEALWPDDNPEVEEHPIESGSIVDRRPTVRVSEDSPRVHPKVRGDYDILYQGMNRVAATVLKFQDPHYNELKPEVAEARKMKEIKGPADDFCKTSIEMVTRREAALAHLDKVIQAKSTPKEPETLTATLQQELRDGERRAYLRSLDAKERLKLLEDEMERGNFDLLRAALDADSPRLLEPDKAKELRERYALGKHPWLHDWRRDLELEFLTILERTRQAYGWLIYTLHKAGVHYDPPGEIIGLWNRLGRVTTRGRTMAEQHAASLRRKAKGEKDPKEIKKILSKDKQRKDRAAKGGRDAK